MDVPIVTIGLSDIIIMRIAAANGSANNRKARIFSDNKEVD